MKVIPKFTDNVNIGMPDPPNIGSDIDGSPTSQSPVVSSFSIKIPTPWENNDMHYLASHSSRDGLVCLYFPDKSGFVLNPTTRWHRTLPISCFQQLLIKYKLKDVFYRLGFGKDKFTGTYKPVWLYNSKEIGR